MTAVKRLCLHKCLLREKYWPNSAKPDHLLSLLSLHLSVYQHFRFALWKAKHISLTSCPITFPCVWCKQVPQNPSHCSLIPCYLHKGFSVYEGKVTDSGWIGPFLSPAPPEHIPGTIHGCLWLLLISGNTIYQVHTCGWECASQVSLPLLSVHSSILTWWCWWENEYPDD